MKTFAQMMKSLGRGHYGFRFSQPTKVIRWNQNPDTDRYEDQLDLLTPDGIWQPWRASGEDSDARDWHWLEEPTEAEGIVQAYQAPNYSSLLKGEMRGNNGPITGTLEMAEDPRVCYAIFRLDGGGRISLADLEGIHIIEVEGDDLPTEIDSIEMGEVSEDRATCGYLRLSLGLVFDP